MSVSERRGHLPAGRGRARDSPRDRGRGWQSARPRNRRPARHDRGLRRERVTSSRSTSRGGHRDGESRARTSSRRGRSTTRSTASTRRRSTSRPSGTTSPPFEDAGVEPPEDVGRLHASPPRPSRTPASRPTRSPARTAGPSPTCSRTSTSAPPGVEKYDQLAAHEIPWTDQSVKDALTRDGRRSTATRTTSPAVREGALQTDNPGSISKVLTEEPEAAMVIEGDFVPASVETTLEPRDGLQRLHLPGDRRLRVGGDRRRRLRRHVQGQPGRAGAGQYLTTAGGRGAVGGLGHRHAQQERRHEPLPGRAHADHCRARSPRRRPSASTSPTCNPRRSAGPSGRACSSSSRTSWRIRTTSTESRRRWRTPPAEAYG